MSSSEIEELLIPSTSSAPDPSTHRKSALHRFHSAPAMIIPRDLLPSSSSSSSSSSTPNFGSNGFILKLSFLFLLVYLSIGVLVYSINPQGFAGGETHPAIDGLYFCIVTLCTIGYGDIHPLTPATKAFSCVFVLVGFVLTYVLLAGPVNYILDVQENMILAVIHARDGASSCIFDAEKGGCGSA